MHGLLTELGGRPFPARALPARLQPRGGHGHHDGHRGRRPRGRTAIPRRPSPSPSKRACSAASAASCACPSRASGWSGRRGSCSPSCATASGSPATARRRVRATLRSRDGKVLARGPADARTSPLVGIADSIAGRMEPEETVEERRALYARGYPRRLAGRAERPRGGLRAATCAAVPAASSWPATASWHARARAPPGRFADDHRHGPPGGRGGGSRGPPRRRGGARSRATARSERSPASPSRHRSRPARRSSS